MYVLAWMPGNDLIDNLRSYVDGIQTMLLNFEVDSRMVLLFGKKL